MGYVVKQSARRVKESSTSPLVVPIAPYLTDDHVAVFLAIQGSASAITDPDGAGGWTAVGTLTRTGSTAGQWYVKKMTADSASESTQSFTFSGSGTIVSATSVVVRGVDTSWLAAIASGTDYFTTGTSSSSTFSSAAGAASGSANALMLVGAVFNSDSSARCYLDDLTSLSLERNANTAHFVGYKQMPSTSFGSPALTAYRSASGNSQMCLLMMKTAVGAALQPNCKTNVTEAQWYGAAGVNNSAMNPTWSYPDAATIDGLSTYTGPGGGITAAMSAASLLPISSVNPDTLLAWNGMTSVTISAASAGASDIWVGYKHPFTTPLSGNKAVSLTWMVPYGDAVAHIGSKGFIVKFSSSATDWVAYQLDTKADFVGNAMKNAVIQPGVTPVYMSGGAYAPGSQADVTYLWHRIGGNTTGANIHVANLVVFDPATPAQITGGGSAYPATWYPLVEALRSWNTFRLGWLQSAAQAMSYGAVQVGDGSKTTYWDSSAWGVGFPQKYNAAIQNVWRVSENTLSMSIKPSSNDTILMTAGSMVSDGAQAVSISSGGSIPSAHSFVGHSFVGVTLTDSLGLAFDGATFKSGGTHSFKASQSNLNISKTVGAVPAAAMTANSKTIADSTIDITGTSATYFLTLPATVTALTLNTVTLTGTPNNTDADKIYSELASGTLTITVDGGGTALVAGDVEFVGGSTATAEIVNGTTITFAGLVAGMKVLVFTSGTQTAVFSVGSSGTSEAWTSASGTFDYVILKAGYVPIRGTGEVVSGSRTITVSPEVDRAYVASSGLTYGTNAVVTVGANPTTNPGTKTFQLGVASTPQNWYSFWIEQWIDKGDSGEALANVAFPIRPNGPNSFSLLNGWEFSDGATSVAFMSRDGLRYVSAAGATTSSWAAILTSGVPSGKQVRYQQSDGGTTVNAVNTGEMDQLVQIYGDATHGNFDRTGYLVLKVQAEGYDQAEANVVTLYGTLEDQLYVVGLTPTANTVATGDPALTITITDHGATPVTWNGKDFSITITDNASPSSGTNIMRELRYNFAAGGTYQGKDGFNWHDLVRQNGNDFKTVRGVIYGDVGATNKGVRVVKNDGTTAHPDFTLFTADDGTTYAPPVTADITVTGMPNTVGALNRLQLINATAVTAAARANSTAYSVGDVRLRQTGIGTENTAGLYLRCTTAGTSAGTPPTWNTTVGGTTTDGTVVWTTYAILYYDADPAATSLTATYIDGEEFLEGETVEIRVAEMDGATSFQRYHSTTVASASGFTFNVVAEADTTYATYALDGSAYDTTFSPDYVASYLVLDTNTNYSGASSYSYFCYLLTTSQGMYLFWDGYTAVDPGNLRIEVDTLDMYFDESGGFVRQTDDVRIFRSDGLRPALDPTTGGNGIEINWRTPVYMVSTGGSALTPTESAQLMSLPSASTIADQVVNVVTFP